MIILIAITKAGELATRAHNIERAKLAARYPTFFGVSKKGREKSINQSNPKPPTKSEPKE